MSDTDIGVVDDPKRGAPEAGEREVETGERTERRSFVVPAADEPEIEEQDTVESRIGVETYVVQPLLTPTNDFVQIAAGAGATVEAQATWINESFLDTGFPNGIVVQTQYNKAWRQSTSWIRSLGYHITQLLGQQAKDDGDSVKLWRQFYEATLMASYAPDPSANINSYVVLNPWSAVATFTSPPKNGTEITLHVAVPNSASSCTLNWRGTGVFAIKHMNMTDPLPNEVNGMLKLLFINPNWYIIAINLNMTNGRWLPLSGGTLTGPLIIQSTLDVTSTGNFDGAVTMGSNLTVDGSGTFYNGVTITGALSATGNLTIGGSGTFGLGGISTTGNLVVSGNTSIGGTLGAGTTTIGGSLTVTVNTSLSGTLTVGGAITAGSADISGALEANSLNIVGGATVRDQITGGALVLNAVASVSTGGLVAVNAAFSGYCTIGANCSVGTYMTVGGNLSVTGAVTADNMSMTNDLGARNGVFSAGLSANSISATGNITSNTGQLTGVTVASVGAMTVGSTFHCNNNATVVGSLTVGAGGPFVVTTAGGMTATSLGTTGNINCYSLGALAQVTAGTTLHVVSNTSMEGSLTTSGLCYNSDALWHQVSDRSIKRGIEPYQRGLPALRQIQPVRFRYTDDAPVRFKEDPDAIQFGFVAQDVEDIIPEMVGEITIPPVEAIEGRAAREARDLKTVAPGHLVYLLVNAVQEIAERLERLEGDVAPKPGDA